MAHDQPTYASVPGIRVFGMMCVKPSEQTPNPNYAARPAAVPQKQTQPQYVPPSPSSYYQRLQKLTLNKLQGQHKSSERPVDTSDFTTRGINVVSSGRFDGPENREEPLDDSTENEPASSTFDSASSSMGTTTTPFITTDAMSTDSTAAATTFGGGASSSGSDGVSLTTNSISRNRRAADDDSDLDQLFSQPIASNRNSRSADDWPNLPWHEISQQIRDIQWE